MGCFGVRCVFSGKTAHYNTKRFLYEERIVVWHAANAAEAIDKAEAEAKEYAEMTESNYLRIAQSFEMFDSVAEEGIEVFSLMRESDLEEQDYLDSFFSTGGERQQTP